MDERNHLILILLLQLTTGNPENFQKTPADIEKLHVLRPPAAMKTARNAGIQKLQFVVLQLNGFSGRLKHLGLKCAFISVDIQDIRENPLGGSQPLFLPLYLCHVADRSIEQPVVIPFL